MTSRRRLLALLALLSCATGFAWCDETDQAARAARFQQVEQMTPEQKADLLRRLKQFQDLPPAERERLRTLHGELQKHPNCKRLEGVLSRYHSWCKHLTAQQLSNLLSLSPEERIVKIQELRDKEEKDRIEREDYRLDQKDLEAIVAWLDERTLAHLARTELRENFRQIALVAIAPGMPIDSFVASTILLPMGTESGVLAKEFVRLPDEERRGLFLMFNRLPPMRLLSLSAEETDALYERLSASAQAKLDRRSSYDDKRQLLLGSGRFSGSFGNGWIWQAARDAQRKYFDKFLNNVPDLQPELWRLAQSLPEEHRSWLLRQSPESREENLRMVYLRNNLADQLPPIFKKLEPWAGSRGPRFEGSRSEGPRPGGFQPGRGDGPPPRPQGNGPGQR